MKKAIDEKKQKWEEARAKYVTSSSFRFTDFIFQVYCFTSESSSFISSDSPALWPFFLELTPLSKLFKIFLLTINEWVKVAQSCPTLCNPMDYIVPGILQARILEWVTFPFSIDKLEKAIKKCRRHHVAGKRHRLWSQADLPSPCKHR